MKLNCEISPGHLRAVGEGLALASCDREGTAAADPGKPSLVAIGLDDGKVRWQRAQDTRYSRHYLHEGYLLVAPERVLGWNQRPTSPSHRVIDRRHAHGFHFFHDVLAQDYGKDDEWTVLDVKTGLSLPTSVLAHAKRAGRREKAARTSWPAPYFLPSHVPFYPWLFTCSIATRMSS